MKRLDVGLHPLGLSDKTTASGGTLGGLCDEDGVKPFHKIVLHRQTEVINIC